MMPAFAGFYIPQAGLLAGLRVIPLEVTFANGQTSKNAGISPAIEPENCIVLPGGYSAELGVATPQDVFIGISAITANALTFTRASGTGVAHARATVIQFPAGVLVSSRLGSVGLVDSETTTYDSAPAFDPDNTFVVHLGMNHESDVVPRQMAAYVQHENGDAVRATRDGDFGALSVYYGLYEFDPSYLAQPIQQILGSWSDTNTISTITIPSAVDPSNTLIAYGGFATPEEDGWAGACMCAGDASDYTPNYDENAAFIDYTLNSNDPFNGEYLSVHRNTGANSGTRYFAANIIEFNTGVLTDLTTAEAPEGGKTITTVDTTIAAVNWLGNRTNHDSVGPANITQDVRLFDASTVKPSFYGSSLMVSGFQSFEVNEL